jgi:hypothetical protein
VGTLQDLTGGAEDEDQVNGVVVSGILRHELTESDQAEGGAHAPYACMPAAR